MGRALVSYYQATHQPRILEALNKVYSRYTMLSPTNQKRLESGLVRGSTNVDAMTETFLENGNKTILDSIIAYSNRPLVRQFGQRIMQMSDRSHKGFKTTHGVTFYEVSRVPAISSIWNGREEDRDVSLHLLSWAGKYNMLPLGLVSCEEYLSGAGPFHGVETCDIPASMWNYTWQMRIDGKGQWGDRIENVFFNAGPVSVSRDWKTMSYYQMPNRFSEKLPADPAVPGPGDQRYTPYGHEVLCCVGSSNWEIPNYVTNMWMATMDHGLAYTLYGPCKVKASLDNAPVEIDCQTDYPFGDQIRIHLKSANDIVAPLYFRIPEWCGAMQIKVNGKKVAYKAYKDFAKIERKWRNGDAVVISLPMKASVTAGICTPYPRDSYFNRNNLVGSNRNYYWGYTDSIAGEPYEYVKYGPLLYALPIKDIDENHVAEGQKYNYALGATLGKVKIIRKKMPERWTWKYEEAPVQLSVDAREFPWTPTDLAPLPKRKVTGGSAARITLVPYNCTKFHVSMFPVAN
ncbi:MAG: glycoside hydrolase family 127 protein [Prevotella sp.]|nr:glycoside hydrolase family 127 protein [Prevotella sp.]